jgi:hypothetical protein
MSNCIHNCHNVTVLLYLLVFPATYRRVVFGEHIESVPKEDSCILSVGTESSALQHLKPTPLNPPLTGREASKPPLSRGGLEGFDAKERVLKGTSFSKLGPMLNTFISWCNLVPPIRSPKS